MNVNVTDTTYLNWTGDCLILGLTEDALPLSGTLAELNAKRSGLLQELIDEVDFKAKVGSSATIRVGSSTPIRKLGLVGLGDSKSLTLEGLRRGGAVAARLGKKEKCKGLGLSFPAWEGKVNASVQAIAEGAILALHEDKRFKSKTEDDKPSPAVASITLLEAAGQERAAEVAQKICDGVILARELVSAPANVVTPLTMAEMATELASTYGLTLEILEKEECEQHGMGAFLGVAQASDLPPKFIHLTYRPVEAPRRKLAIIGKVLTFDSGGLNIKGAGSGIEMMKIDMGGAAATFGAAKAIAQLKPDVEVHFISAATENMISGHAMHPGDILTASNGKTIEVYNTDAEGRLSLADALVFADKLGVDAMIDLATLTGACIVALGDDIGALFSPDDDLAAQFSAAAKLAGEKLWKMPMEEKYFDGLKSVVADMKNTGPRAGGSITAALFLQQLDKDTPWMHWDVAGQVRTEKESGYNSPGGTGYGVRALVQWVLS